MGSTEGMGICHAYAPDGRCISLLKILLTNSCIFDCHYCINRKSSNVRRQRRRHRRPRQPALRPLRAAPGLLQRLLANSVALGATAARALTGTTVTIATVRDAPLTLADGGECWVTVHPSYLLRLPDADARRTKRARFVDDLKRIRDRAALIA